MKINTGMNGDNNNMYVNVSSPLLEKYYSNFTGMIKNDKRAPSDITIEKVGLNTVLVQFPISPEFIMGEPKDGKIAVTGEVAVSIEAIIDITNRFTRVALKKILSTTEFCPILDFSGGYSFEELQEDVKIATKNKRDILVIDSYENYKSGTIGNKYEFNQYSIPYGTDEYCNFVLSVIRGDIRELQKEYKPKLAYSVWV